jgi:hypothetical protein
MLLHLDLNAPVAYLKMTMCSKVLFIHIIQLKPLKPGNFTIKKHQPRHAWLNFETILIILILSIPACLKKTRNTLAPFDFSHFLTKNVSSFLFYLILLNRNQIEQFQVSLVLEGGM